MRSSKKRKATPSKSPLDNDQSNFISIDGPTESESKNSDSWGREYAHMHLNALRKDAAGFLEKYLIPQSKSLVIDANNTNTSDASSTSNPINSVDTSKRLCLTPGCKRKCGSLCSLGFEYSSH